MFDIAACAPLHTMLLERLAAGDSLALDASAVERVSTAGVQLLLSAAQSFISEGRAFQLNAPSQPLLQAVEDLGLQLAFSTLFTDNLGSGKE
jgi:anti-anti-sigma regulatory factor